MKKTILPILIFVLVSCSETSESRYSDYKTLKNASKGEQSWFPEFVLSDCTDFKEIHNSDVNTTFGRFKYSTQRIPALFSNRFERQSWKEFETTSLAKTNPIKPKWFIDYAEGVQFYKHEEVLYALDTINRIVYFVR